MRCLFSILALFAASAFCDPEDSRDLLNTCVNSKLVVEEHPDLTTIKILADSGETLFNTNNGSTTLSDFRDLFFSLNELIFPVQNHSLFGNCSDLIINKPAAAQNKVTISTRLGVTLFRKALPLQQGVSARCAHVCGYNLLVDRNFDVNRPDGYNTTSLVWSSFLGLSDLARSLVLERGADVNQESLIGITPIMAAISAGQTELVEFLIQKGANITGALYDTPLHTAAFMGRLDIARSLIEHGADVNAASNGDQLTPLHYAAVRGYCDVVGLLISRGADVNVRTSLGETPLHAATSEGHSDCGHTLLAAGADINAKDTSGNTALMTAIRFLPSQEAAFQVVDHFLKEHNPDISIRSNNSDTAQSIAEKRGFTKVVELLKSRTTA